MRYMYIKVYRHHLADVMLNEVYYCNYMNEAYYCNYNGYFIVNNIHE